MMATVEVYDPAHPEKLREGADAAKFLPTHGPSGRGTAFCGKPPENFGLASLYDPRPTLGFWSRLPEFGRGVARSLKNSRKNAEPRLSVPFTTPRR